MTPFQHATEKRNQLLAAINLTAEETQAHSDRIQKRAHAEPELTALCEFSATIQLRRLIAVSPRAWGNVEIRWVGQILEKLVHLKSQAGFPATLALACLGYARPDLPLAMDALQAPVPPTPPPALEPEPITDVPEPEPVMVSAPDEELDPQTQAALDALRAQAKQAGVTKSTPRKR